jgi:hypothetical protein
MEIRTYQGEGGDFLPVMYLKKLKFVLKKKATEQFPGNTRSDISV